MKSKNKIIYTYSIILVIVVSILLSLILDFKLYYALLIALIYTSIISLRLGTSLSSTCKMIILGMRKAEIVLVVMSIVGMLISIWMAGGTIPSMIYYGFEYLSKTNIIFAAFIISSVVSMVLGTAIGTISTIGSVFLSLAYVLNVPLGILVGAIVSGAYLGDRTSPMSSSANLLSISTKTDLRDNIVLLLKTAIPVYIICCILYWHIGSQFVLNSDSSIESIKSYKDLLVSNFSIDVYSLFPPLIILISTLAFRVPIILSLLLGLLSSIAIILIKGDLNILNLLKISIFGYHPVDKTLSNIVSGGGIISMKNVLLVVSISTGLTGILQGLFLIEPLIERLRQRIKTSSDLLISTILTTVLVCFITCSQALTIILPSQYLGSIYDEFSLTRDHLVRTIADIGIIIVPIVPWNLNAIMITSLLKVTPSNYVPYTYMCLLLPIVTIMFWLYYKNRRLKYEN